MGGGIAGALALVVAAGDHLAVEPHHRAHGHVAVSGRGLGLGQCQCHQGVVCYQGVVGHGAAWASVNASAIRASSSMRVSSVTVRPRGGACGS